jgi:hypothetical protein
MLAEWEAKLDGWKFGKFATMDVTEIEAVAGAFAKRVYKLQKDPAVRGWKVSSCGCRTFYICHPKQALTGVGQPGGRAGV